MGVLCVCVNVICAVLYYCSFNFLGYLYIYIYTHTHTHNLGVLDNWHYRTTDSPY
jgi:hypothetical protein